MFGHSDGGESIRRKRIADLARKAGGEPIVQRV